MFYKKHSFQYNVGVQATLQIERSVFMANQTNSLSHTKWMCKYHIVFTPKYRRKIIYNQYRESLREIIKLLCKYSWYVFQPCNYRGKYRDHRIIVSNYRSYFRWSRVSRLTPPHGWIGVEAADWHAALVETALVFCGDVVLRQVGVEVVGHIFEAQPLSRNSSREKSKKSRLSVLK